MRINHVTGMTGAYNKHAARKVNPGQEVTRTEKMDEVVLSKEAQEVLQLKERLSQTSDIRQERIAELKRQIESGTYRPDSREVAARLLKTRVLDDLV